MRFRTGINVLCEDDLKSALFYLSNLTKEMKENNNIPQSFYQKEKSKLRDMTSEVHITNIILRGDPIDNFFSESNQNVNTKKIIDNAKKEVEERLYKDELTGLKNRKSLEDSIKGKDSVVAILLDVDAFEDLNELYGFINAEEVLKELSNILREFEKTHDVVAYRLSGDIFALTNISNIPFENIFILIEELNKTFLNRKIFVDKLNVDIVVSMTMGISIFQEEPILTAAMALKKAKSLNQSYFVYNNELDSKELIIQSLYWREKIKPASCQS